MGFSRQEHWSWLPFPSPNIYVYVCKRVCVCVCVCTHGISLVIQWRRICLQYRRCWRCRFDLWFGKIPWRRTWQPAPVLLPGVSHGQRSLTGYSPWGREELGTTEYTCMHHASRVHSVSRVQTGSLSKLTLSSATEL